MNRQRFHQQKLIETTTEQCEHHTDHLSCFKTKVLFLKINFRTSQRNKPSIDISYDRPGINGFFTDTF